ncbi:GNAT family N-acetyltransferase [Prauserella halophila]|nr:GNAT family N-acetyltransferase [Prauserella halophila]
MRIRPTALEDADALTDLHLDVWDEAYTGLIAADILADRRTNREARVENWRRILAGCTRTELAAEDDTGRLIGFTSVGPGRDEPAPDLPKREVMALYVRAECYGTGVGHALLNAAIGDDPAYLWVLDGNRRAIDFYERQGFHFDGTNKTEPVGVERRMVRR